MSQLHETTMPQLHDWKDNEFGYCQGVVRTQGNRSVPREYVASYLGVQIASARADRRPDVVEALIALKDRWTRDTAA